MQPTSSVGVRKVTRPCPNVSDSAKGVFTGSSARTELTCNKSTHAFIGQARQHHDMIGCSGTRTLGAHRVLNTCISMQLLTLEFVN